MPGDYVSEGGALARGAASREGPGCPTSGSALGDSRPPASKLGHRDDADRALSMFATHAAFSEFVGRTAQTLLECASRRRPTTSIIYRVPYI